MLYQYQELYDAWFDLSFSLMKKKYKYSDIANEMSQTQTFFLLNYRYFKIDLIILFNFIATFPIVRPIL